MSGTDDRDLPRGPVQDLAMVRARLASSRGREFWRSLDELSGDPVFQDLLKDEFPAGASEWEDGLDRRRFLQLAAASLAFAGLSAFTRQPLESIVPYVKQPEEIVPGRPRFFATAATLGGFASGLLVESHEGRPTKIEGNPDHPASLGATDLYAQARVLGLYDPDRSPLLLELGVIRTRDAFVQRMQTTLRAQQALGGAGIRVLTGTVTSPTLGDQVRALLTRFPKARWHQHEPAGRDNARLGARLAFGDWIETRYDFSRADVVLALDSDFLVEMPGSVRYARDFADGRRMRQGRDRMSRLYAVESTPTATGTLADHRRSVRASQVNGVALACAAELGLVPPGASPTLPADLKRLVSAACADLKRSTGHGLVVAGATALPAAHALAHAINHRLGNAGATVIHTDPVEVEPVDQTASIRDLVEDMRAGRVDLLAIVGGNPVFDAPADLGFTDALLKVPLRIHLALEEDETSEYCHWHVPQAHPLETWGDARAYDGTVTVMQPLIEPLYGGRSAHELVSAFLDDPPRHGREVLRESWRKAAPAAAVEAFWRKALHDGFVPGTSLPPKNIALRRGAIEAAAKAAFDIATGGGEMELIFRPDPTIHDGRFANNGWLQELPKPLSKMTWDNAAYLAPADARRLGTANGDVVEIEIEGRKVEAPAWVQPGHPDGAVTLHFGYGRTKCGRVGANTGFNAYVLRTSRGMWSHPAASIRNTGKRQVLACTQEH